MNIPRLRAARRSIAYLYADLISTPATKQYLTEALSAVRYYALFTNEGRHIYSQNLA
jgi:hypothetical protein